MKIAVVSIPYRTTPPSGYGGIERVVYEFVEELVRQGHEIVLFATPGSYCSGITVEVPEYDPDKAPSGMAKGSKGVSEEPLYKVMRDYLDRNPVDLIHDWSFENLFVLKHLDAFPFLISTCIPPIEGTKKPNMVAASKAHSELFNPPIPFVHYGLNLENYPFQKLKNQPMIHIAKIAAYKGQHLALLASFIARENIILAGNVEDKVYFRAVINPMVKLLPTAEYIGEIPGTVEYLKSARALIQTPRWFDVLPLVILESLACGTPVVSLNKGGIPEQIDHGVNGFLCDSFKELILFMKEVDSIKPENCRETAEKKFNVKRMVQEYVNLYNKVINGAGW